MVLFNFRRFLKYLPKLSSRPDYTNNSHDESKAVTKTQENYFNETEVGGKMKDELKGTSHVTSARFGRPAVGPANEASILSYSACYWIIMKH